MTPVTMETALGGCAHPAVFDTIASTTPSMPVSGTASGAGSRAGNERSWSGGAAPPVVAVEWRDPARWGGGRLRRDSL